VATCRILAVAATYRSCNWLIVNSVNVPSMRRGKQTSDQVHSPPWDWPRIMCYGNRVAVLISVDVFRRLMGYLKSIQALSFVVSFRRG